MSVISIPYTFSPNTTISSSQINANFTEIYDDYNGGISAANLATDAVTTAKIADGNVTTAKLADDAVTAAKIGFGGSGTGIWWEEIGRTTLGVAGDTITVSGLPARKYLKILVSTQATGGTTAMQLRFNNDTANNYSWRNSNEGAADTTGTSVSVFNDSSIAQQDFNAIYEVVNIATSVKFGLYRYARGTTAASSAPSRLEGVGKWANTTTTISRVDIVNTAGTGDFAIGSEVVVLGHD